MRRSLSLIIALMLLSISALAISPSLFDYTCESLEDGSTVYHFKDLSLTLPAYWSGKTTVIQSDSGISFYQAASRDAYMKNGINSGGFLFQLRASADDSYQQLPSYEYLGFSDASNVHYYLLLPSDYPAYNENAIRAEYDKMYGDVAFLADNAIVFSDQDSDSSSEEESHPAASWTVDQVRYAFEHSMLPRYFHSKPESMLNGLASTGLYPLWASVSTENGVDPTYPEEEYIAHWYVSAEGTTIAQFELPEPDANTLCYRIYFLYNPSTGDAAYYTIESDDFVPDLSFICMWTKDMEHVNYGAKAVFDRNADNYPALLRTEAEEISELAGYSSELNPANMNDSNLASIPCPEQGFSVKADPEFAWDYREGTGISIYTEHKGSIPYVIIFQGNDKIAEPFEYIQEQYTPYMQKQYGSNLVSYTEFDAFEIGGKQLPAGLYTYRLQGYLIDMLRIYDSTGPSTIAFTAKYIQGQGDATLEALDTAVRTFERNPE